MASTDVLTHPPAAPPAFHRWSTLGVVTLGTFLLALDLTIVNVALPSLRVSLHASFSELQWVIDTYALTLAALLLTSGSIADRIGSKVVYTTGLLVFTLGSLASGLAWDGLSLNLARGLQGVGAAVLFAVGPALIGQVFRGRERGVAFSIFGGGVGLGLALGPLIGGAVVDSLGWRWIFLLNVPIGAGCLVLGLVGIQERRDPRARPIDGAGLVTFSIALALLVLALLRGEDDGWGSPRIVGGLLSAAVMLAGFLAIEIRRGASAMLDLALLRNRTFLTASAIALLMTATLMFAFFLLISYLQNVLGFSAWQTGVRFLWLTVPMFLAAAVGGVLTTRVPFRIIIGLGALFLAIGLALIKPLIHGDGAWTDLIPSMVLMGIGVGMYNPARASISIAVADPRKAGMASGINETFQQTGWALGIAGVGAMFQARVSVHFLDSGAADRLGSAASPLTKMIAAGDFSAVAQAAPPGLAPQLSQAARSAFVHGMTDVTQVVAVVAFLTAAIGFAFITNRDLDPSALGGLPGALPEIEDDPAGPGRLSTLQEHRMTWKDSPRAGR